MRLTVSLISEDAIMKVVIMPNLTRQNAYETMIKLCESLDILNIEYAFLPEDDSVNEFPEGKIITAKELPYNADVLITIGGDGTMIRAAMSVLDYEIPLLGINAGNLAYLMGLEADEMILLNKLISEDYNVEERLVLQVDIFNENDNHVLTDFCINEVVLARGAEIKLTQFDLFCDNRFINRYNADGLIISTPTGSTAYNLASGGPIVDPRVDCMILSPICPHSLVERTVIFNSDSVFRIENPDCSIKSLLSCDGRDSIVFDRNYKAIIKKADKKVKLIRLKDDTFMEILHKKMKTNNR